MQLSSFDYTLPDDLIAQHPVEPRSSARLLVDTKPSPTHATVQNLPSFLEAGDLVVVNNTKVIPARIRLRRETGGAVEVLLLEPSHEARWECLVRPGGKLKKGEVLLSEGGVPVCALVGRRASASDATFEIDLLVDIDTLFALGEMPLPPYIRQSPADTSRYQTVYAQRAASAAAPTAGLHLTAEVLDDLTKAGVGYAEVELVVGIDTFRPIEVDDVTHHVMHSEFYSVPSATLEKIEDARRVVAIGTTTTRALESMHHLNANEGRTRIFITPGHQWGVVDLMMTNFHQPRTTLLVMIEAFVGPRWRMLYETAILNRYRMLSFGDAMLLNRHR